MWGEVREGVGRGEEESMGGGLEKCVGVWGGEKCGERCGCVAKVWGSGEVRRGGEMCGEMCWGVGRGWGRCEKGVGVRVRGVKKRWRLGG